ncbi:MAG: DUF4976 domain-containing protein, partial [Runella slithyformis]
EEAIRIPMLVRYPPLIKAGMKPKQMVLSIDLASTLLDIAGQTPGAHLQGKSWVPIFKGKVNDWRSSFLVEYYSDSVFPRIVNMGYKAVRDNRFKYIHYVDLKGMNELYDLAKDPYELHNIIDNPKMNGTLKKMKKELNLLLTQTGADGLR